MTIYRNTVLPGTARAISFLRRARRIRKALGQLPIAQGHLVCPTCLKQIRSQDDNRVYVAQYAAACGYWD